MRLVKKSNDNKDKHKGNNNKINIVTSIVKAPIIENKATIKDITFIKIIVFFPTIIFFMLSPLLILYHIILFN